MSLFLKFKKTRSLATMIGLASDQRVSMPALQKTTKQHYSPWSCTLASLMRFLMKMGPSWDNYDQNTRLEFRGSSQEIHRELLDLTSACLIYGTPLYLSSWANTLPYGWEQWVCNMRSPSL